MKAAAAEQSSDTHASAPSELPPNAITGSQISPVNAAGGLSDARAEADPWDEHVAAHWRKQDARYRKYSSDGRKAAVTTIDILRDTLQVPLDRTATPRYR